MAIIKAKRSPIVNIQVKRKDGLGVGEVWWHMCEEVVVSKAPYLCDPLERSWKIELTHKGGHLGPYTTTHYLADLGFPGHAYDDRPCRLTRSLEESTVEAKDTKVWHEWQDFMDPPIDDDHIYEEDY